jgi:hypothetical protein
VYAQPRNAAIRKDAEPNVRSRASIANLIDELVHGVRLQR